MARVIEFEGRRIEVPDDATDAEVASIIDGGQPAPAPAAAPAGPPTPPWGGGIQPDANQPPPKVPERSWLDAIMSVGTQGAVGAREGAANVLGLPVDAVNNAPRLLNLLPGVEGVGPISDRPIGGSEQIGEMFAAPVRAAQAITGRPTEDPAPNGLIERGARRVGQEVGGAAVPAGGILAKAGGMTAQAAREAGPLAKALGIEKAVVNPNKFVRDEAAMAMAAGTGAAGGREFANTAGYDPNSTQAAVADFVGALTGAGTLGFGKALGGPVSNIVGATTGNTRFADSVVRDKVVDTVLNASGAKAPRQGAAVPADDLIAAIRRGDRVGDSIPGFLESTADRTKNPGLAALEYNRQSSPTGAGTFTQRRAVNAQAVDNAVSAVEPSGTPGSLSSAAEARREPDRP